jgi:hypothetical protein
VVLEVKPKNSTIGSIFLWLITPEEAFIERMIKLDTPKMSERGCARRLRL